MLSMRLFLLIMLASLLAIMSACQPGQQQEIDSFEQCVEAGNPVMESYPRQCNAGGENFIEEVETPIPNPAPKFHECSEEEKEAEICILVYDPVCGLADNEIRCITAPCPSTDAVTYSNGCEACSSGVIGYYEGSCIDQEFVVCQDTATGFDPVQYASDAGGICVDVCPNNYDPFVTQAGIQLCIRHYGIDDIIDWVECARSSDSCECALAYETTTGEMIDAPKYRCVPKRYAERLLFRSGLDRLDEKGEKSVVIA